MQIVIPMSGFGERFRRAGYRVPKPLIEVEGKPIIAHVIDLFPGERDFIFICNQDHLDHPEYRMESILQTYCPTGRAIGIAPHKLGPIHAVRQVEHLIGPARRRKLLRLYLLLGLDGVQAFCGADPMHRRNTGV
ncbi:TPA: hypothetical protein SAP43_005212 [Burkholderia multivorans]|nr:hypothetical protein [Burkholderia multivorans]